MLLKMHGFHNTRFTKKVEQSTTNITVSTNYSPCVDEQTFINTGAFPYMNLKTKVLQFAHKGEKGRFLSMSER